jgi:hypothetical protein
VNRRRRDTIFRTRRRSFFNLDRSAPPREPATLSQPSFRRRFRSMTDPRSQKRTRHWLKRLERRRLSFPRVLLRIAIRAAPNRIARSVRIPQSGPRLWSRLSGLRHWCCAQRLPEERARDQVRAAVLSLRLCTAYPQDSRNGARSHREPAGVVEPLCLSFATHDGFVSQPVQF